MHVTFCTKNHMRGFAIRCFTTGTANQRCAHVIPGTEDDMHSAGIPYLAARPNFCY